MLEKSQLQKIYNAKGVIITNAKGFEITQTKEQLKRSLDNMVALRDNILSNIEKIEYDLSQIASI